MKTTPLFIIFLIISNSFIVINSDEGENICEKCFCDKGTSPLIISCDKKDLSTLFTNSDWVYTISINNFNVSVIELDVRFDENEIRKITIFPSLPIVSLSFRGNKIDEIEPYAFKYLDNLVSLDLSGNNFTAKDLPESVFEGKFNETYYKPLNLQQLNMSNNKIHTIEKDLFDHFPQLTSLDLSGNPLKILGGSTSMAIADLLSLEYLNLANTEISDIPVGMIHSLKDLISLDLSFNDFTQVPNELKSSHSIKNLIMDGNKFKSFDKDSFQGLEELEELSISYLNNLRMIEAETFGNLKKLKKLYCHHNRKLDRISNAAFYEISENPDHWPVKEIYLNDNDLTHIDEALAAWEAVNIIDIQNNPFICDCNIKWMSETLLDQIRRTHSHLTESVNCAEPKQYKGASLLELGLESNAFTKCKTGNYQLFGKKLKENRTGISQALATTVLVIGVLLMVIALSILGVIFVKRRAIALSLTSHQQIRYQRADEEDFS